MPRKRPFSTVREIEKYLAKPMIECLECGKWFNTLGIHLNRVHHMTADDYRGKWQLPRLAPLSGTAYREKRSEIIRRQIEDGALTYDHLADASEKARAAERPRKVVADAKAHSERMKKYRPGDHHRLPPGAKRADGRDADRAREYQQQYRLKHQSSEDLSAE